MTSCATYFVVYAFASISANPMFMFANYLVRPSFSTAIELFRVRSTEGVEAVLKCEGRWCGLWYTVLVFKLYTDNQKKSGSDRWPPYSLIIHRGMPMISTSSHNWQGKMCVEVQWRSEKARKEMDFSLYGKSGNLTRYRNHVYWLGIDWPARCRWRVHSR